MLLVKSPNGLKKAHIFERIQPYREAPSTVAANKMFDRDKNALRSIGIPLELIGDNVEGALSHNEPLYRIQAEAFTLSDLELSVDEAAALAATADFWQGGVESANRRALGRIDTAAGTDQLPQETQETPLFQVTETLLNETIFSETIHAISTQTVVSFRYKNADGTDRTRKISPWAVIQKNSSWYLCGYDHTRQERRYFKLSRIKSDLTEEHYERYVASNLELETLAQQLGPANSYPPLTLKVLPESVGLMKFRLRGQDLQLQNNGILLNNPDSAIIWDLLADPDLQLELQPADHPLIQEYIEKLQQLRVEYQRISQQYHQQLQNLKPVLSPRKRTTSSEEMRLIFDMISFTVARGGVSHQELQKRYNLSPTQLKKRLEKIPLYGLPDGMPDELFELEDDGEYISLRQVDAVEKPLSLDPLETLTTLIGLQLLATLRPDIENAAKSAHTKISRALATRSYDRIGEFVWWDESPLNAAGEHLKSVKSAIEQHQNLKINYRGEGERTITPLQIRQYLNQLYIVAWCHSAAAPRIFRLDRCYSLETIPGTTVEKSSQEAVLSQQIFTAADHNEHVTVYADYREAEAIIAMNPTHLQEVGHGNILARVPLASEKFFVQAALSLAPRIVILEPQGLVQKVHERINHQLELLSNERY